MCGINQVGKYCKFLFFLRDVSECLAVEDVVHNVDEDTDHLKSYTFNLTRFSMKMHFQVRIR